jgi:glycosyltransferase involved in cell wall biosynthesis
VSDAPLLVNARFVLTARTGLQRAAEELLVAVRRLPYQFTTVAPARPNSSGDLPVDRVIPSRGFPALAGRTGALAWEQLVLPAAARGRTVFSPVNLAPLAGDNIVLVHDLAPTVGPEWFSRSGRVYGRIVTTAARRARIVLTVSEDVRDQLSRIGVPSERLKVVRPAVTPSLRPADDDVVDDVRRRHGLHRPYFLFVGWADPRKDVTTAIAASDRIDLPHDLVLVGRPHPNFAAIPEPKGANVRRLGYVSDDELVALLTGATALLYPSRYEGFGLPPLEAAACGTPALVSDIPVLHESSGGVATFVPTADVSAWADALVAALRGELPVRPPPAWSWADAAKQFASAVGA